LIVHKPTRKYLERHAEPDIGAMHPLKKNFGHVVVIPAYGEGENLFRTLESIPPGPLGEVLVILVVNARADSPPWVHTRNRDSIRTLKERFSENLLLIDRASPGKYLPKGQGVGLARKIGCDGALSLFQEGRIRSPWIHCTDADAELPPDYFKRALEKKTQEASTLIYPFHHLCEPDPSTAEAMRLYEISLRYYVLGLHASGSPYAYHSLGSSLAVRAESYAEIGGFPKKNAGEDFYLLNKLAKVGLLLKLPGLPLRIQGRLSDRVPFGTGMGLHKILHQKDHRRPFRLYHPLVFSHLSAWLKVLEEIAAKDGLLTPQKILKEKCEINQSLCYELLDKVLKQMEAFDMCARLLRSSKERTTRRRHLHLWWDAFRTLKFVHALRDQGYPSPPIFEALSEAPFLRPHSSLETEDWEGLRYHLARCEGELSKKTAGLWALEET
jgi:hypothetical protein